MQQRELVAPTIRDDRVRGTILGGTLDLGPVTLRGVSAFNTLRDENEPDRIDVTLQPRVPGTVAQCDVARVYAAPVHVSGAAFLRIRCYPARGSIAPSVGDATRNVTEVVQAPSGGVSPAIILIVGLRHWARWAVASVQGSPMLVIAA